MFRPVGAGDFAVRRHADFVIHHSPFTIRRSPFVIRISTFEFRHSPFVSPLQGSMIYRTGTQGVALGWYVSPRWGWRFCGSLAFGVPLWHLMGIDGHRPPLQAFF
jgi:hypothetical protein